MELRKRDPKKRTARLHLLLQELCPIRPPRRFKQFPIREKDKKLLISGRWVEITSIRFPDAKIRLARTSRPRPERDTDEYREHRRALSRKRKQMATDEQRRIWAEKARARWHAYPAEYKKALNKKRMERLSSLDKEVRKRKAREWYARNKEDQRRKKTERWKRRDPIHGLYTDIHRVKRGELDPAELFERYSATFIRLNERRGKGVSREKDPSRNDQRDVQHRKKPKGPLEA